MLGEITQRRSALISIGMTSKRSVSRALITERADRNDTSRSHDIPPKIIPTRVRRTATLASSATHDFLNSISAPNIGANQNRSSTIEEVRKRSQYNLGVGISSSRRHSRIV